MTLETVAVTRYVTPLREGGSLPGIVEADDLGTYVCKFRGAGQGTRVLVAEVIVSGLAQRLGLSTPRLVVLDLDPAIARYEADEEVQDLLNASPGPNLGVDFLPGAFGYDGELDDEDDPVGARILWLDAFTANVDRSWRNPNLLRWHDEVWVIDHGAALYFHHGWSNGVTAPERFAAQAWDASDHVLRQYLGRLAGVDGEAGDRLGHDVFVEVLAEVPDAWLEAGARRRDAGAAAGGVRRVPRRPARHPRVAAPGARVVTARGPPLPVRRAALRAARGPRGVRQRRGGALLPGDRLPRGGLEPQRRAAAGDRPARRRRRRLRRAGLHRPRLRRRPARPVRRGSSRSAPASASSGRRGARCSSPARCTAG